MRISAPCGSSPSSTLPRWPPSRSATPRLATPNFRLGTVCQHAGIEFSEDEAHDALYDIRKTWELWQWRQGQN